MPTVVVFYFPCDKKSTGSRLTTIWRPWTNDDDLLRTLICCLHKWRLMWNQVLCQPFFQLNVSYLPMKIACFWHWTLAFSPIINGVGAGTSIIYPFLPFVILLRCEYLQLKLPFTNYPSNHLTPPPSRNQLPLQVFSRLRYGFPVGFLQKDRTLIKIVNEDLIFQF